MALVRISQSPFTIVGGGLETNTYLLSDANDGYVGTIAVGLDTTSAGTIAVTVKGRVRGLGTATTPPFLPIPYLVLTDGGTVAATPPQYASANLTGDGDLILIPASGLDIALDIVLTSGSHTIYYSKLVGASA